MRRLRLGILCWLAAAAAGAAGQPPIYIWFEPEWFEGVQGHFAYWPGPAGYKATGAWGIAGPGISAEWTQGGESEWNSMGVCPLETKASCYRDFIVPRAGKYKLWVRYVDHRQQTEPFTVTVQQGGAKTINGELGVASVVPPNDEYELYWGFSFGWGSLDGDLKAGPARLAIDITRVGEGWRQVDAVLLTDDPAYRPYHREKPPFHYTTAFALQPTNGAAWRGSGRSLKPGAGWQRPAIGGRDFSMWAGISDERTWWSTQNVEALNLYDLFFQFSAPADIRATFHQQFTGRRDLPIMAWPNLLPGLYLASPDLAPGTPLRRWLERTKTPFYLLTNYANPAYNGTNGPATYQALAGPLAAQFLGFIHGEAMGTSGITTADRIAGQSRRAYIDALGRHLRAKQTELWSAIYKTAVPDTFCAKSISCLSCESIALCHLFHEMGAFTVGYEEDATNVHVPMRIAFERGAARQYGGAWINYASGNFGDACNYFTQEPVVARGAKCWFHSKYAVTDGVSANWYRKLYYLNYLSGASAIFWEQGLGNQWMQPGPGTHPIQLSPMGRATVDFQAFVDRLPDRGEPYTPVAMLLSYGHGYERVNYTCKMLDGFVEDANDLEVRELFNVCWHPTIATESQPAAPDVQSLPGGIYGNIFDILVDRPARAKAIMDYPVVWVAGDADLTGPEWSAALEDYLNRGGTLVVNVNAVRKFPVKWLGAKFTGTLQTAEDWRPAGGDRQAATPFEVAGVELQTAQALAWAGETAPLILRNPVGAGTVIVTLVPRMLGLDERAHPALAYLMNGIVAQLLPVELRLADGRRLNGEVMYQVNRTRDGWLVMLINNLGVDKTQSGVARVDRSQAVSVVLSTSLKVAAAKEYTQPQDLAVSAQNGVSSIALRIHPGDVQVVGLVTR